MTKKLSDLSIKERLEAVKKALGMEEFKADEANHTENEGYGAEFVDTALSSNILEKLREATNFSSKFPAPIDMPTPTYELPVEGQDPEFKYTGENGDVPATEYPNSKVGTGKIVLTAKKFTAITYLSGELDEDAIISMRPYVEDKIAKQYKETLDKVLINGDTTNASTGNINSVDAQPEAGAYYLALDGLRKNAIANDMKVDAGALELADIRTARAKMGRKGLNPEDLILGVGTDVYFKLLSLSQAETVEKFGQSATVLKGTIPTIDGVEVVPTGFIEKAQSDGTISSDPANNTTGQAILVYKDDVIRGFKRQLKTFVEYLPNLDQYRITAHFRYAQVIRDTDSVVLIHNITL